MKVETFVRGPLQNNVYLLWDEPSSEAAIIDPGIQQRRSAAEHPEPATSTCAMFSNTHRHFDHVDNDEFYREQTGAPIVFAPRRRGDA